MTEDKAISLNAVLEKAYTLELKDMWQKTVLEEVVNVKDIKQLPSVTPNEEEMTIKYIEGYNAGFCHAQAIFQKEPKTGHWIFVDKAKEHAHCSECDYGDVDLFDGRPHNYCPNCGTKIIEPQERSDEE